MPVLYKRLYKYLCIIFLILTLVCPVTNYGQKALAKENSTQDFGPQGLVQAESAIIMDVKTGRIIYQKQAYQPKPQASTTKITTCILALEKGDLNRKVKVSKNAADTGEAGIWLSEGEELTLRQLVEAMMIYSANDAAVAVAEAVGDDYDDFIEMMNRKVKEIGATNTHYQNPHGLDEDNHFSTAYDLAIISRYGMLKVPSFHELVSTDEVTIPWPGHEWDRVLHNRNKLLDSYTGADGVKTGYTSKAGKCLVASATRGEVQLIAVVLDSPDRFEESKILLDYGFEHFEHNKVISKSANVGQLPVKYGYSENVNLVAKDEVVVGIIDSEQIRTQTKLKKKELEAPVKKGEVVGEYDVFLDGKQIASVPIVTEEKVERKALWKLVIDVVSQWLTTNIAALFGEG